MMPTDEVGQVFFNFDIPDDFSTLTSSIGPAEADFESPPGGFTVLDMPHLDMLQGDFDEYLGFDIKPWEGPYSSMLEEYDFDMDPSGVFQGGAFEPLEFGYQRVAYNANNTGFELPRPIPEPKNLPIPDLRPQKKSTKTVMRPTQQTVSAYATEKTLDELTGLYFTNYEDVLADDDITLFNSPRSDVTIPTTPEQKQAVIKTLVGAISNNIGVRESTTSYSFQNRWADGATYYRPIVFEKLAWGILNFAIALHTDGWKHPVYDNLLADAIMGTKDLTFQERMNIIVELLKFSKRTCEDMLKGEKHLTVIGAPHVLESRTKSNKIANKMKAERIAFASEQKRKEREQNLACNDRIQKDEEASVTVEQRSKGKHKGVTDDIGEKQNEELEATKKTPKGKRKRDESGDNGNNCGKLTEPVKKASKTRNKRTRSSKSTSNIAGYMHPRK